MQVILIKDHDRLGSKDTIVSVRNGYGRNYLIPQKYAVEAIESNLKQLTERNKVKAKKADDLMSKIHHVIDLLKNTKLILKTKVGQNNRIFGRITSLQISHEIKSVLGFSIDKKAIIIEEDIKETGSYVGKIEFDATTTAEFNFEVVSE
ncbi:MAG: 50S ribosomal protein L9 [Alphaproteobacteria bacterium]|nr:50S ribosomal protein L9 [Alphaproteobacteria bacterium]